jgi:rubrerythrin
MFDVIEVFEIAQQIEHNAARFYRKAAEIFDNVQISETFTRLADWEEKHELIFSNMKTQLSELDQKNNATECEEKLPDPKVMAGLAVFGIEPEPREQLSGNEGETDILKRAVEKEKDSIVFYAGLKDFVADGESRDKIDDIIKEEMRHINILYRWQKRKTAPDV